MRARFLKPAEAELEEASAYLEERRAGLGDRFEADVNEALSYVMQHPLAGKRLTNRVRAQRLRTFRYNVIYAIDEDEIVVLAVAHHRRRPDFWRRRLNGFTE
jgi:mRNA-degrading endonuclease RelE of RelBE toxin-antitoxin system